MKKIRVEELHFIMLAKKRRLQFVSLISNGTNIDVKDKDGNYPIHLASGNGLLSIVKYLIKEQNVDKDIKGQFDKTISL